jgi:hypothetical protein
VGQRSHRSAGLAQLRDRQRGVRRLARRMERHAQHAHQLFDELITGRVIDEFGIRQRHLQRGQHLLTMIVSLQAIVLSTFVMISQNRADEKRQAIADQQWRTVQEEEQGRVLSEEPHVRHGEMGEEGLFQGPELGQPVGGDGDFPAAVVPAR